MNGTLAVRWPLAHGSWKPLPQQTPAAWEERVCGNDIVRNVLQ